MAVVYKAKDTILGRCVALKTLHRRYAEDETFRSRFKQEARVMASLDHENVVKVYDISQDGEVPFIVAEYIGGRDVESMLKSAPRRRLSEQFTKEIATQLLRALAYAHRRGVIHRDVKPSNVLLTEENTVKVADFGIARVVEDEEAGEPGEIIGSARYMSPEQLRGEETTPRSDLYSVGILLYYCLTGRPPFSGGVRSVIHQQIHREPSPPRKLNKAISPHLEAVILKALAKDPKDRYLSASAMLEDLRRGAGEIGLVRVARKSHRVRKALLAFSMLALLLLGGGTAAAGLGYVNLEDVPLPWQAEEAMTTSAQPVAGDPPEVPEAQQAPEEPQASKQTPEQTPEAPQAPVLAPVPNLDAYFDWYAEETLKNSGFQASFLYEYREGYAPRGVTWGTDPIVGTLIPLGSTITVYATPKDEPQVVQPQAQPPQPQVVQPQAQLPQPQVQPQPQPQPPQPQVQAQPQAQPPQPQVQPQIRS
jgi:eukaryotic-like serine/threonine-protein kinase